MPGPEARQEAQSRPGRGDPTGASQMGPIQRRSKKNKIRRRGKPACLDRRQGKRLKADPAGVIPPGHRKWVLSREDQRKTKSGDAENRHAWTGGKARGSKQTRQG